MPCDGYRTGKMPWLAKYSGPIIIILIILAILLISGIVRLELMSKKAKREAIKTESVTKRENLFEKHRFYDEKRYYGQYSP